jgi:enoyl-CoA hydratase
MNALSADLLQDFNLALDEFESDDSVRVGILRGAGRAFCVGFDLSEHSPSTRAPSSSWSDHQRLRLWIESFLRLRELPKPVVAEIHGHCLAGGLMMPPCCDVTVISKNCVVCLPKLPLGGGFVGPVMSLLIGAHRAKLLEFDVGREITGETAASWGFASLAVPDLELTSVTRDLALRMSRIPPSLLGLKKRAINDAADRAGFRDTYQAAVLWDTLSHTDKATELFRSAIREQGMKAAITAFSDGSL